MDEKINEFISYLENERRYQKTTINSYNEDINIYKNFIVDKKLDFINISKDDVRSFLKYLDTKKYSKTTISRILSSLRHFYNYLLTQDVVEINIFKLIRNPKKDKKMPNFLQYNEFNNIIDSIPMETELDIRNRLIIELLYATGLRVSELTSIEINDINLADREIRVLGKGNKERIVFYGEYASDILHKYLNEARPILLKKGNNSNLLLNKNGGSLTSRGVEKIISNIITKLSLKHNVSPHTLRHTFATDMLNNGADLKTVQELLGHSSLSTTQIYTHLTNERLRSVYLDAFPRNKE